MYCPRAQLGEVLRPSGTIPVSGIQSAHHQERARELLIKEILRRRTEVDHLCPVQVRLADDAHDGRCAVCLDSMEAGDLQRTLRCGHAFHSSCIDRWFMQMCDARYGGAPPACPVCKQTVGAKTLHLAKPPLPPAPVLPAGGRGPLAALGPIRIPSLEPAGLSPVSDDV